MRKSDIKVGHTYCNKGSGTTKRKVLAIGDEHRPEHFWSYKLAPEEPGVLYEQTNKRKRELTKHTLYLTSFAQWAGSDVTEGE